MIDLAAIEVARERIAPHIRRTPVMALTQAKEPPLVSADVILKLECLQVTGSFKARGAMNRLLGAPAHEVAVWQPQRRRAAIMALPSRAPPSRPGPAPRSSCPPMSLPPSSPR